MTVIGCGRLIILSVLCAASVLQLYLYLEKDIKAAEARQHIVCWLTFTLCCHQLL